MLNDFKENSQTASEQQKLVYMLWLGSVDLKASKDKRRGVPTFTLVYLNSELKSRIPGCLVSIEQARA